MNEKQGASPEEVHKDPYVSIAVKMFNVAPEDVTPEQRRAGKSAALGASYGKQEPTTLADVLPQPGYMLWLIHNTHKHTSMAAENVYSFELYSNGLFDLNAESIESLKGWGTRWSFDPETPHAEANKFYT